jgi:uncharacterized protein with PhoU and TrkA domain
VLAAEQFGYTGIPPAGRIPVEHIERIVKEGQDLAIIIRKGLSLESTTFVTPPEYKQQVGFVVHPAGAQIHRHTHRKIERHMIGTSEVLVLLQGRCEIDIYDDQHGLVHTSELHQGDVMLMVGGGHGFRMLEDTVFLEVKQGPYLGVDEKEPF